MKSRVLLILMYLFAALPGIAQNNKKTEAGLRLGIGFSNEVLPERKEYKPIIFLPYFNYYITPAQRAAKLSVYVEPQLTPVLIDYQNSSRNAVEYEFGFNAGAIFNYQISKLNVYAGVGSGPNFISMQTRQQADGFLFSDNFFVGVKREMKRNYRLDMQLRLRHISNAGLQKPNNGIDNLFAVAGISKMIGKSAPPTPTNKTKKKCGSPE